MTFDSPKVMGIVNVTPDSFFSGSRTPESGAIEARVVSMRENGADIIDLGGYSSRPGADEVSPDEEYRRLATGLEAIRKVWPEAPVSVDTFRADVARKCITEWDVDIINDISGGSLDPEMWPVVADLKAAYILMHMRGTPSTMQSLTDYADVTADVISDLAFKADKLHSMGVADVIIDPGFGFAKTTAQNLEMLARLSELKKMGMPILAGMSRKSMIWRALDITPEESLPGTIALDTVALLNGADIIRVHDVKEAVQTVRLLTLMNQYSSESEIS
ncbi:MAG: dihydropteroate synthase [Muribaculum sp.]|nr:dihydropteroate synthase [Muribaculum sp.]